jgi:hypothetical protein
VKFRKISSGVFPGTSVGRNLPYNLQWWKGGWYVFLPLSISVLQLPGTGCDKKEVSIMSFLHA